jgi:vacuolar-type H+-ATPase subunit H
MRQIQARGLAQELQAEQIISQPEKIMSQPEKIMSQPEKIISQSTAIASDLSDMKLEVCM